ncbi:MAG: chemotaxis protein CheA [Actinobacteria bacterium]|nr:chemotaxis protein CheA [Actinomycetota bacterium]
MSLDASAYHDIFNTEAAELLDGLNDSLLALERNGANESQINETFRIAHTLKGMAATMGFDRMADLTHGMETLLDRVRSGEIAIDGELLDLLFSCLDALNSFLKNGDIDNLEELKSALDLGRGAYISEIETVVINKLKCDIKAPDVKPPKQRDKAVSRIKQTTHGETIRVNAAHLDNLLNLVSEMVISLTHLEVIISSKQFESLTTAFDKLNIIASELQQETLQMRMVPVSYTFNRFPRMVRDAAHQLGKEVDLMVKDHNIKLDRMVLDEISEPLVHLLRNAVDHGIEPPDDRVDSGKPRRGTISLSAARKHDIAIIEVSDDGRGIDVEKIKRISLEKGMATKEEIESMEGDNAYSLLYRPKFTTMSEATSISGRGVGLNAVKDKIDALGGVLRIHSKLGLGTTFSLEVPLTLALIPALMVTIRRQIFALPLSNVIDIVSCRNGNVRRIGDSQVVIMRGETVPLVDQQAIFGGIGPGREPGYAVIVQVGDNKIGLKVEHVLRKQEIVVKPLCEFLQCINGLAGSAVLGDGRVALVIDPRSLLQNRHDLGGSYA